MFTGIVNGPAMSKIRDAIMFHNCFDNVLEYVSDRDSGRLMRNLAAYDSAGTLDPGFWGHMYDSYRKHNARDFSKIPKRSGCII